jgi:hypothetical protein
MIAEAVIFQTLNNVLENTSEGSNCDTGIVISF